MFPLVPLPGIVLIGPLSGLYFYGFTEKLLGLAKGLSHQGKKNPSNLIWRYMLFLLPFRRVRWFYRSKSCGMISHVHLYSWVPQLLFSIRRVRFRRTLHFSSLNTVNDDGYECELLHRFFLKLKKYNKQINTYITLTMKRHTAKELLQKYVFYQH